MRYLYKFHHDFGRMGDLNGLFVATEEQVKNIIGKNIYFGECLGKHSDIDLDIEESDIVKQDLDSETVEKVTKLLGVWWSGKNPVAIYDEQLEENSFEDDDEDEEE